MFYVYRFLDKKHNIIYVGKAKDLDVRIKNHIDVGHLPLECYKSVWSIEYLELPTRVDMEIMELYLINLYKPFYNKLDVEKETLNTVISNELRWEVYEKVDFRLLLKYKNQLNEERARNRGIQKKYHRLLYNSSIVKQDLEHIIEPYYLRGLHGRLEYITGALATNITPVRDIAIFYNFKEVVQILKNDATLTFKCMNKDLHIIVYRKDSLIYFEETTPVISECIDNTYIINLDPSTSRDIGSYNLAGVVPYLHYTLNL